jgi:MFS family permease
VRFNLSPTARALLNLYIPALIMSFGQGMVVPTIPILAHSFDVTVGLAAQAVTAQLLGRAASLVPIGYLIDRYGRRPALVGGPIIMVLTSVLTAVTPWFPLFLVAQLFTGVGLSLWHTAREVAAVDLVRADQRGRTISAFQGMSSVGAAMGPVLGGLLSEAFGFRSVFWVYAVTALFTLVMSLRVQETGGPRLRVGPPLRRIGRITDIEPYFRWTYVVLVANTFVAMMRGALINSIVPLFIGVQLGYGPTEVGAIFTVFGLMNVLMIVPTGFLSDKKGRKVVVVPATYIATVVFLAFPFASDWWHLMGLAAAIGIATGLSIGSMATYTYDVIPDHARASLQTLRRTIGESGGIVGPALAGVVADAISPGAVFWCFVPLQIVAGVLITFVARESLGHVRRRQPE